MLYLLWLIFAINRSLATAKVSSSPPVLIWGIETPETKSIFRPMKTGEFAKLMKTILKTHMIAAYFASELAAKDINCAPCFPYLQLMTPLNYYSQVEEPMVALQQVSDETKPITWHKPVITEKERLEQEMELPCEKGRIHAFSFDDRNLPAHDNAMAVCFYQFSDCPVVHVYTAFTEENKAYLRRKAHALYKSPQKSLLTGEDLPDEIQTTETPETPEPVNTDEELADHFSFSQSSNMTILRREAVVFAFGYIMLAIKHRKLMRFDRSYVSLVPGNQSMQVGMYNDLDVQKGLVLALDTDAGPLAIELLPVQGNWHVTRAFFANRSFFPHDLIFFGTEFSLCCHDVTFFAADHARLSVFEFHLDIITSANDNGMSVKYEPKPCWSCTHFMSAVLTQSLVVLLFFVVVLWFGMSFITSIGRNKFVQVANEPDLHIKADL